jgi:predicted AlkP superfamily pyrophosphatase or phosphodiesterase
MNNGPESSRVQNDGPTVIIIADGWTRAVFLDLLNDSKLPEISDCLVSAGGLLTDVVSNLPSVSLASHASILTSTFQDEHGIPGHRWFDKASGTIHDYVSCRAPVAVNRHLNPDVSTVFEQTAHRVNVSIQGIVNGPQRFVVVRCCV